MSRYEDAYEDATETTLASPSHASTRAMAVEESSYEPPDDLLEVVKNLDHSLRVEFDQRMSAEATDILAEMHDRVRSVAQSGPPELRTPDVGPRTSPGPVKDTFEMPSGYPHLIAEVAQSARTEFMRRMDERACLILVDLQQRCEAFTAAVPKSPR